MNTKKNKSLNTKKYKLSFLTENNFPLNESNKNNATTEFTSSNNSLNKLLNIDKTSTDFHNFKRNRINNFYNIKSVKFINFSENSKNLLNNDFYDIARLNTIANKTISSFHKSKGLLPYLNNNKIKVKRPSLLKLQKNLTNDLNTLRTEYNIPNYTNKDRLSNIKSIFNKKENDKNNYFKKDLKKIDDNIYKYSVMIKNLDMWDKDHCQDNKAGENINLFHLLYDYFDEHDLSQEKKDLLYASNIIKVRHDNNNNNDDENKQKQKIMMNLMKGRRRERGGIFRSSIYRKQIKLGELFDKKYTKEFDDNLDLDPDSLNLLLEDQMKSMFYNQIIKDRIKYEKQLHDDLLKINNIIFKRKNIKEEKTKKLKEYYAELTKLKKEYDEEYTKNRKTYWIRYDSYEHYYKNLKESGNVNYRNQLRKKAEYEDLLERGKRMSIRDESLEGRVVYKSPSPKKRRTSIVDKNILSIYKNSLKSLESEKNFKLLQMNNEMNSKLREIENHYGAKMNKINNIKKRLENDIKIHKLELTYYKGINDELVHEHKVYYMNKLKKGYDCRKEGLMWVVYNLLELQVPLEYHHFPKYLTHEQIDYLKKYAKAQLKQDELKIIINTLKKKQNTQKMKDVLKCMDVIDNIVDLENKNILELNEENEINNKDFINAKMKIDKKFLKLYQDNIDIMKNYLFKNVESLEFHKVIKEMKKDIYKGSNSDINKSKKDVLNVFMGDKNNKNFFNFLVDIKANYQRLESEKEQLFEKEKINYFKLIESNMNNKTSIDNVAKNEMIKRCLFGTRLE